LLNLDESDDSTGGKGSSSSTIAPIKVGDTLTNFKSFVCSFPPDIIGESIGNSEEIREAHNSFALPDPFMTEEEPFDEKRDKRADVFHFVSYVCRGGKVYELDGLQRGPLVLGEVDESGDRKYTRQWKVDWLEIVRKRVLDRINGATANADSTTGAEIKFNLMAIGHDKLANLKHSKENGGGGSGVAGAELDMMIEEEEKIRQGWEEENRRR